MLGLVWQWILSDRAPGGAFVPRSPGQTEVGQEPTTTTGKNADNYKLRNPVGNRSQLEHISTA